MIRSGFFVPVVQDGIMTLSTAVKWLLCICPVSLSPNLRATRTEFPYLKFLAAYAHCLGC